MKPTGRVQGRIRRVAADFDASTLTLVVTTTGDNPRRDFEVVFRGVATHHLEGIASSNLLHDVEEDDVEEFYETYRAILDRQKVFNYPFKYRTPQDLATGIRERGLQVYRLLPARTGLAGFVLAKAMEILD